MKGCFSLALMLTIFSGTQAFAAQKEGEDTSSKDPAELYRLGEIEFEKENYVEALQNFRESYDLSGEVDLLYNIAICNEKLGDNQKAIAFYELYLEEKPQAEDAEEIRAKLDQLKQSPAEQPKDESAEDKATLPTEPSPSDSELTEAESADMLEDLDQEEEHKVFGPGILIGVGGLVLVSGTITAIAANKKYRDTEKSLCGQTQTCSSSQLDGIKAASIAADVQFAVGGSLVAAGFIWWMVQRKKKGEKRVSLTVAPSLLGEAKSGGLSVQGRF